MNIRRYASITFLVTGSLLLTTHRTYSQPGECQPTVCTHNGGNSIGTATPPSGSHFQKCGISMQPGWAVSFPVVAGETYEWSSCPADGAGIPYYPSDINFTLRRDNGTFLCHSEDVCGSFPKIRWTADQTGTVILALREDGCSFTSFTTRRYQPSWRCVSCAAFTPCEARTEIRCATTYTATHDIGTGAYELSCGGGSGTGKERAYLFVPGSSGPMQLEQLASHAPVRWYYKPESQGCGTSNWTCIGTLNGNASSSSFMVNEGARYLLMADPEAITQGDVTFQLGCTLQADLCLSPTPISCGNTYSVTIPPGAGMVGETVDCGLLTLGKHLVFAFTTVLGGDYTITQNASEMVTWLVSKGDPTRPCEFVCMNVAPNVGSITTSLKPNMTYYFRLNGAYTTGASVTFTIDCSAVEDPCTTIDDLVCGVPASATVSGTGGWNGLTGYCGTAGSWGRQRLYSFTPSQTGAHSIEQSMLTQGQMMRYFIKPQSGGCTSIGWSCIGSLNGLGTTPPITLEAGVPYYIMADALYAYLTSSYTMRVNCPPPPTDPCPAIVNMACGIPVTRSIAPGQGTYNPPQNTCGYSTPGREQVLRFTAPYSGTYNIRQFTAYDWTDYFFKPEANGCSSTGWTCIDDLFGAELSAAFTMLQGVTYLIMADPESSNGGILSFQLECSSPYDACALIEPLAGCNEPMSVQLGSGNGSYLNPGTSCGANTPGRERVFTYSATQGGQRFFQQFTSNGTINYYVKPLSGGCDGAGWTCLGGISGAGVTSTYSMTTGTSYLVMLDALSTAGGTVEFTLGCAPSGNVCTTSTVGPIDCGTDVTVSIPAGTGRFLDLPGCGGGPMPGLERVFTFTASESGPHTIIQSNSFAVIRYAFKQTGFGTCVSSGWTCIGYQQGTDEFGPMNLVAGTTYWLLLDAATMSGGPVTFRVECPGYDACTDIQPISCGMPQVAILGSGQGDKDWNNCNELDPVQDLIGKERIFRFSPSYSGFHTITQTGTGGTLHYSWVDEPSIENNETNCTALNSFVCWDVITGPYEEAEPLWLDAGIDYLIMLDQFGTGLTSVTFTIHCPIPPNDDCANAQNLVVHAWNECPSYSISGTTAAGTTQDGPTPQCSGFGGLNEGPWTDVWYTFNSGPTDVVLTISPVAPVEIGLELRLANLGECNATPLWCIYTEETYSGHIPVQPNTQYLLRAYTNRYQSEAGNFTICLSMPPPPACVTLLTPTDISYFEAGTSIEFDWAPSPSATHYLFEIWNSGTNESPSEEYPRILFVPGISIDDLPPGDYSWQVKAINSSGALTGCSGRGFTVNPPTSASLLVPVRAVLDGAWVPATGLMRDNLRSAGLIPVEHPYGGAPWFHDGSEELESFALQTTGPNAIVDWLLVELRAQGAPHQVVARRAGLLQLDGDITDTDGTSPLLFPAMAIGNYHVSVQHRNHLGVMTQDAVLIDGLQATIDFSSAALPTYGSQARKQLSGGSSPLGLWAGDVNADGALKYVGNGNDRDPMLVAIGGNVPTNIIAGYRVEDISLDGLVKYVGEGNDRDPVLQNIGGTVPTAMRPGTLP